MLMVSERQPKQKVQPVEIININGREATTVAGARKILSQRVKDEHNIERSYSRDAVYAMFIANKIEGIRTPSANYYFLDSLRKVSLDRHRKKAPEKYTQRVKGAYPQEVKNEAVRLYKEGNLTKRAIARQLDVSYQTINNWTKG